MQVLSSHGHRSTSVLNAQRICGGSCYNSRYLISLFTLGMSTLTPLVISFLLTQLPISDLLLP